MKQITKKYNTSKIHFTLNNNIVHFRNMKIQLMETDNKRTMKKYVQHLAHLDMYLDIVVRFHWFCWVWHSFASLHRSHCILTFKALIFIWNRSTLSPAYNEQKDAKETARYKWVLVVTKLFNMAVNDFDAKQSARYSRVLAVTELVLSGTQCTFYYFNFTPVFLTIIFVLHLWRREWQICPLNCEVLDTQ